MREVYSDKDYTRIGLCKSALDAAGIANFIQDNANHDLLPGLHSPISFPVLCVSEDADYDRAIALLRALPSAPVAVPSDWRCPNCGEELAGSFGSCWNCGALRPEATAAT